MKDPKGLLMIEPTCAATVPLIDDMTRRVTALWRARVSPDSCKRYRGMHTCTGAGCRSHSDNLDHAIRVGDSHIQTNSLIVHYVACHREDVDDVERAKVERLFGLLGLVEQTPTTHEITGTIIRIARPEDLPPEMGGPRPRRLR